MSLDTLLRQIEQMPEVESVQGDFLPAPPTSTRPGNHLFINCVYRVRPQDETPEQLLAKLRRDALAISKAAGLELREHDFVSLCLSFFDIHKERHGIRIYRTAIAKAKVPRIAKDEMAAFDGEESHHAQLRPLLMNRGSQ